MNEQKIINIWLGLIAWFSFKAACKSLVALSVGTSGAFIATLLFVVITAGLLVRIYYRTVAVKGVK